MVSHHRLAFLAAVCVLLLAACRTEELKLYPAYMRGELWSEKPRTDGFYYRHIPPCGRSLSITEVVIFYQNGACYQENWSLDTSLAAIEESLSQPVRYSVTGQRLSDGMGWGICQWDDDTLHIEQLTFATRGRVRVTKWKAVMHGDVLQKVFRKDSPLVTSGLPECVRPFDFHPTDKKPDPKRFFEQDKQFLRSQKYYMEQARKRELHRPKP